MLLPDEKNSPEGIILPSWLKRKYTSSAVRDEGGVGIIRNRFIHSQELIRFNMLNQVSDRAGGGDDPLDGDEN